MTSVFSNLKFVEFHMYRERFVIGNSYVAYKYKKKKLMARMCVNSIASSHNFEYSLEYERIEWEYVRSLDFTQRQNVNS